MTASSETQASAEGPLGARWRAAREATQERVLPPGQVLVSCPAPLGAGGLGRHLRELIDAVDRRGPAAICMCGMALAHMTPSSSPLHHELRVTGPTDRLARFTRFSPAWANLRRSVAFDGYAAQRLPAAEHLIAFNGQALKQFGAARSAHFQSLALLSANSHMRNVVRQHAKAHRRYPLEGSWATRLVRRNEREYRQAERIYVASRYTLQSFVEEGCSEDLLTLFPFVPDARFQPERKPSSSPTFDVVYSGRLTIDKGVPLLVDAVRRLEHADLRLLLVGGWSSRGMRRFLEDAVRRDPRITIGPGDPLAHLRSARLYVHPAYEDGFSYSPAEAMACAVPVLVSEDTGMKELVDPGVNGLILPTGDLDALTAAIDSAYRGEIFT